MRARSIDDVARDLALIERIGAFGRNALERRRERRILQRASHRQRRSIGIVEVCLGALLREIFLARDIDVQPRAHRKALLGQPDRRLEQLRPLQLAVLPVRKLEQAQGPGHADRLAADDGIVELERFAFLVEEPIRLGGRRRCLAPVVGSQQSVATVMKEHERAAANSR